MAAGAPFVYCVFNYDGLDVIVHGTYGVSLLAKWRAMD